MKNIISALFLGGIFIVVFGGVFQLSNLYSPISEVLLSKNIGEWAKYSIFTAHEVSLIILVYIGLVFLIKNFQLVKYNFTSIIIIQLPILLFFFKEKILFRYYSSESFFNPYIVSSLLVTFVLMFGLVSIYIVDKRYRMHE